MVSSVSDQEVVLLTESEAADLLAMAPSTLRMWRYTHSGPPFFRLDTGAIRYEQAELIAWVSKTRVVPESRASGE